MKKIALLILKCVCVMFPLILICFHTATSLMSFVSGEAPFYLWNKAEVKKRHDNIRIVVLGDSTANAAYIPEVLSADTINLSLGGITPVENYYIMKEWLKNNAAPSVVYVSYMDFHMSLVDCFWDRTMYSRRFPIQTNAEILRTAWKYKEKSFLPDGWLFKFISYELFLPDVYIASLINASLNQRYDGNFAAYQSNGLHGGRYMTRGNREYAPKDSVIYDRFSAAPMHDFYYRKLIKLCLDNKIAVRLVKLPLPNNSVFTEQYTKQFWEYHNKLKEDFPDITVDWFPVYQTSDFVDTHHMNTHGAFRFSRELKERYPGDFTNQEMTPKRIDAINDNIKNENRAEDLYLWAKLGKWEVIRKDNGAHLQVFDHYNNKLVR